VRVGVVILPDLTWPEAIPRWREAEARGFSTAWTYDHMSWRSLRDGPWLGAVPLLAAVAASTTTLRLGTLVATPNFRHPAVLAKEAMTIDHIAGGRFDLGLGAGGTGYDATLTGTPLLPGRDRAGRFAEFVEALDLMLRQPATSFEGRFFTANEVRTYPGCSQRPRVPLTVAAAGSRALAVAARYADTWVTVGPAEPTDDEHGWYAGVAQQSARLDEACAAIGRDPSTLRRSAVAGLTLSWAHCSSSAWSEFCGRVESFGFTDVVVHWPRPHDPALPGPAPDVFEAIDPAGHAT
jgi:alkanesulfonate monooxygenase SsuD/methylene tetrahydromethanopterin reductase-like flavin-dependent oxidoreductase (luciferase family)